MARLARLVVPALPHHITQRGNRRQETFLNDGDYAAYLELMAEWGGEEGAEIWAYCLMPNHVHLIPVPRTENGLRRAIGEAHLRYTRRINFREKWRGYLWQGRFASFIMDEPYLLAAARYVELNPVRAKLALNAADWPWSSAKAHLSGRNARLVKVAPLLAMVGDWQGFLNSAIREEELRTCESTDVQVAHLEVRHSWNVWRPWLVAYSEHRKAAAHQNYANRHNWYCVPGFPGFHPYDYMGGGDDGDERYSLESAVDTVKGYRKWKTILDNQGTEMQAAFTKVGWTGDLSFVRGKGLGLLPSPVVLTGSMHWRVMPAGFAGDYRNIISGEGQTGMIDFFE